MRRDLSGMTVPANATVRCAVNAIDSGGLEMALVLDETGRLLGAVTDGDIRRGLLGGVSIDQPVELVMNRKPRTVSDRQSPGEALSLMRRLSIKQVPALDPEGKVAGVFWLDDMLPQSREDTWVVLMAGGQGMRLRPLTETVPKPMIHVGGRPLLETIVRNFRAQGYHRFYISVNYLADVIQSHFGDGRHLGVEIEYLLEEKRMGTAGALSLLPSRPTGPTIVMNGDLLTTVNFRQLVDFHRDHGARATMCVREYAYQVPYGVVQTDGSRLTGISEKPTQSFFVNAGIYVIDPSALVLLPEGEAFDMPELFDTIANGGSIASAFPIHEYWLDIGRLDDLERAKSDFGKIFDN